MGVFARIGGRRLRHFHLEILDDLIGQKLLAGFAQQSFGRAAIGGVKFDVEDLALPHASDSIDVERLQRALDGLALRIEDAVSQRDDDPGFHRDFILSPSNRCAAAHEKL